MRLFARRGYIFKRMRSCKKRHNKFNRVLTILLIFVTIFYSSVFFERRIKPTILTIAEAKATQIATRTINETISDIMTQDDLGYEDLVVLQKNNSGEIIALQTNVITMNKIKSQLLLEVQEKIESVKPKEVGIPIGNIINSRMFSGWGPIIPARLISVGIINTDFKNSFEAAGINQTKHEISVEVTGEINILLPILSVNSEVVTTVPIAHTILVGDVPDQYINIEGTTIGFPINK